MIYEQRTKILIDLLDTGGLLKMKKSTVVTWSMRLATSMTMPGETRSRGMPGPNRPAPPFIASTTAKAGVSALRGCEM